MIPAKPKPRKFKLRHGSTLMEVEGWETSYTLGIYASADGFASAMLMSGMMLADGFETLEQAHEFNKLVIKADVFTGTPFLDEFFERAGGVEATKRLVVKLQRQAMERTK